MKVRRLAILVVVVIGLMGMIAIPAAADPITLGQGQSVTLNFFGVNPGYSGTATLTLNGNQLSVTLTNTGSAASFIGALGLNTTPNMTVGSATFGGALTGFSLCGNGGCGLGSNIEVAFGGNGSPNGLHGGQTGTIVFTFSSTPSNPNPLVIDFDVVHFQGLGASEKISHTAVPEPASLILMGTGLMGFGSFARKRFRKQA